MKKLNFFHVVLAGTITLTSLFGFNPSISAASAQAENTATLSSTLQKSEQSVLGKRLIATGEKYLGVPYKLGAEYETSRRFDCSSFTQLVFKKNGFQLARGARGQYKNGKPVARKDLNVGDLVFFSTTKTVKYARGSIKRIGHVGIYAGNNKVLHTYGKGGVKYTEFSKGWWAKNYVGAVRVIK